MFVQCDSKRTYHVHVSKGRTVLLLLSRDSLGLWDVLNVISRVADEREMKREKKNKVQMSSRACILNEEPHLEALAALRVKQRVLEVERRDVMGKARNVNSRATTKILWGVSRNNTD